jgi:hypothetical protein
MDMSSFTISDLWSFVRRRDLFSGVNGGVVRLNFYRYGVLDLTLSDRFLILSHGYREDNHDGVCPGFYVLNNDDCTLGSLAALTGCQISFSWKTSLGTLADVG